MNVRKDFEKPFYLVALSFLVMVILVITFGYEISTIKRQTQLLAVNTARAYLSIVINIREWNGTHDGLYVFADKVTPNPYLDDPLKNLVTTEGYRLTKLNPAYMTRLLGEWMTEHTRTGFRLTSLKPINPANAPDPWEREVLEGFERGEQSRWALVNTSEGKQLRYMEPLYVTEDCLQCHGQQGYRINQLRGGLAVSLPYEPFVTLQRSQVRGVVARYLLFTFFLVATTVLFAGKSLRDEQRKRSYAVQLEYLSRIDGLTGLLNRRALMAQLDEEIETAVLNNRPLSILLLDLNDFKKVNDTYGHLVGDLVLKHAAAVIKENVRSVDSVGRYGGDEFMVILPGLTGDVAGKVKERIKTALGNSPIEHEGLRLYQQVSCGVGTLSEVSPGDTAGTEQWKQFLIQEADRQLYLEKQAKKQA